MTSLISRHDSHSLAGASMHFEAEGTLKARLVAGERFAEIPIQFRIARLPQFVTHVNARKIYVPMAKFQRGFSADSPDSINAPTLLCLVWMSGVEHHAVAGFERGLQLEKYLFSLDP